MKTWWQTKAWPWLQKNWQWILLPIGILMVVGKAFGGRRTTVVSSELTGAAEVEHKANEVAAEKVQEAKTEQAKQIAQAKKENEDGTKALTEEQRSVAKELVDNPDALNAHLRDIGKQVRK